MNIEVKITFSENEIIVQSGDLVRKYANLIVLEKSTRKIVDIGETEEKVMSHSALAAKKDLYAFEKIYSPGAIDCTNIYTAIMVFTSETHYDLRGINLLDQISCQLNIPTYNDLPEIAKRQFEYTVQKELKVKTLTINGTKTAFDGWRFSIGNNGLTWGRYAIYFASILALQAAIGKQGIFSSFGLWGAIIALLLVWGLILVVLIWLVELIWIGIMATLLPKQYVSWIIESNRGKLSIPMYLVNKILKNES